MAQPRDLKETLCHPMTSKIWIRISCSGMQVTGVSLIDILSECRSRGGLEREWEDIRQIDAEPSTLTFEVPDSLLVSVYTEELREGPQNTLSDFQSLPK
jgi:hypothetical protein